MGRPTKELVTEKRLKKIFGELREAVSPHGAGALTVRELVFARLIAEEGYNQSDAYREAAEPSEDAKPESINQIACRWSKRPRVQAEIERIKRTLEEDKLRKEERLAVALDGQKARDRMAVELYFMATSDIAPLLKLKAWEMLGKMKHVDAFQKSSTIIDASRSETNTFIDLNPNSSAEEARASVIEAIRQRLKENQRPMIEAMAEVIDV